MLNLISKAKRRDPDSFIALIENAKPEMYKIAYSILHNDADAADAISETILKSWKDIDKLRKAKYFKTWLIRILINNCNDIIRKNSRTIYVESYESIEPSDDSEMSEENISECFDGLCEKHRLIMILYYSHGFKIREIAQMLDMNENTVKTRLSRARNEFKEIYRERTAS